MVLGKGLSFKPAELIIRKNRKRKWKKQKGDPEEWNPDHVIQLAYDMMLEAVTLPAGWRMWGSYFRWVFIKGQGRALLRVQRVGRRKPDGGYETHAILFRNAVPYLENTADFFLDVMEAAEKHKPEENPDLCDRDCSWFQWLKRKMEEERKKLKTLDLTVRSDRFEVCTAFVQNFSRQFFQNSRLKVLLYENIAT